MSRSRRNTPIFGMSTCRSERQDKVLWHGRLRAQTRTAMTPRTADELLDHVLPEERHVSNVWAMAKDGRQWWPVSNQHRLARLLAGRRGHTPTERTAIEQRLLHKWMAK